ncbi:ParA family protein [Levilinea saccharolytica]|uniref:Sporulation initiation inhibitor Soj n=1 Tax=Levilinea saccharolytica TaxID=229921 RepID=A0A0P6YBZ4_9CHLR|nr:ParA family protein [Levilinea saccharolytica]KPL90801.1 sporulation initiation inhibitor Soj [Levilinea saccharolytica]GAP17078.1 chromosome segregation ATPase [Levilinea saccharolytica]
MTRIYTLVNQKGGVGKTTSAINLGAYLGYYGQRVLLIDLDPQANATLSLGVDKTADKKGMRGTYEVLIGAAPIGQNVLHNPRFKISLLPSSPALAGAEVELPNLPDQGLRLRSALELVSDRYDYVLIDCPPSLGVLTVNGLAAARDGVIIPVQCEFLALEGLGQITATINRVRVSLHPELTVRGVVLTMFDGRTRLAVDVVNEVRRHFPNKVFQSIIPRSIRLAEAPSFGQPISTYAPESSAARAYAALAREILEQDGIHIPDLPEQGD